MHSKLFKEIVDELSKNESFKKVATENKSSTLTQQDDDVIRALYGIKSPIGDILDLAHPETAVVSPAYDAMNGVVENLKERQNIMAYIATKMPHGSHIARRYVKASEELIMEVIKAAEIADNNDNEDLAKFADSCASRIEKVAWIPQAIWGTISAIGVLSAYLGVVNNVGVSEGIVNDLKSAITELQEASEDVYPITRGQIVVMIEKLAEAQSKALDYLGIDLQVDPEDLNGVKKVKDDPRALAQLEIGKKYMASISEIKNLLPKYIQILQNASRKEEGVGSFWAGISNVYRTFEPDDVKDAIVALEVLARSIDGEITRLQAEMRAGQDKGVKAAIEDSKKELESKGPLSNFLSQLGGMEVR